MNDEQKVSAADRLADAMQLLATNQGLLLANQPKREMTFGDPEFQQLLKDRGYYREFAKPLYQNTFLSPADCVPVDIVNKVNALKPGKYLGGRVTVRVEDKHIQLVYPTATPDDRMTNAQYWRTFDELIERITAEAAATA
jgi:hypothetical protein